VTPANCREATAPAITITTVHLGTVGTLALPVVDDIVSRASSPLPATAKGMSIYGCEADETALFAEMAPRLGVTPMITAAPVGPENVHLAAGNSCVSVGHKAPIPNPTLLALSRVGVTHISTRSIGYNHLDRGYAESLGIDVSNVSYSPDSVADYTLMLMLMAVRRAKAMIRRVDAHDYRLDEVRGRELRDLTVGVVGTGRIGGAVVARLRGFGCRVLAHDRAAKTAAEFVELDQLLQRSDVVTLHAPLAADTHHLLDRARLARMKPGAYVVNTGRGALIDTEALAAALASGALAGAALDVVEGEEGVFYEDRRGRPPHGALLARLQAMPNVVISPHTAYYTDHALSDMVENSILDCLSFAREGKLDA
jgi:D-specific alpha-keto acid dehydrogenase